MGSAQAGLFGPEGLGGDEEPPITIDFDGMAERIVIVPIDSANYFNLQTGEAGWNRWRIQRGRREAIGIELT